MFIVSVKRVAPDAVFKFEELAQGIAVRHADCGSSEVDWAPPAECGCPWKFTCRRCGSEAVVPSILDGKLKITETALDEVEREITPSIRVVPSTR
ncbi:hypothetical protein [Thermodesulfitimonas autotrophica]|uniref:hypothetical protein n=1 Tax=Thermodesulfitimonas autotrophica TaxID=1894989 RepID=UPI002FE1661E